VTRDDFQPGRRDANPVNRFQSRRRKLGTL
jgi:hypothetical protein